MKYNSTLCHKVYYSKMLDPGTSVVVVIDDITKYIIVLNRLTLFRHFLPNPYKVNNGFRPWSNHLPDLYKMDQIM